MLQVTIEPLAGTLTAQGHAGTGRDGIDVCVACSMVLTELALFLRQEADAGRMDAPDIRLEKGDGSIRADGENPSVRLALRMSETAYRALSAQYPECVTLTVKKGLTAGAALC